MSDDNECTCGHVEDEHGHDRKYPGSTACNVPECECVAFESSDDGSGTEGR